MINKRTPICYKINSWAKYKISRYGAILPFTFIRNEIVSEMKVTLLSVRKTDGVSLASSKSTKRIDFYLPFETAFVAVKTGRTILTELKEREGQISLAFLQPTDAWCCWTRMGNNSAPRFCALPPKADASRSQRLVFIVGGPMVFEGVDAPENSPSLP